jgi:hypothetical protein
MEEGEGEGHVGKGTGGGEVRRLKQCRGRFSARLRWAARTMKHASLQQLQQNAQDFGQTSTKCSQCYMSARAVGARTRIP